MITRNASYTVSTEKATIPKVRSNLNYTMVHRQLFVYVSVSILYVAKLFKKQLRLILPFRINDLYNAR